MSHDFTFIVVAQCYSMAKPARVGGFVQYGLNTESPHCTCGDPFCVHIGEAKDSRCQWHEMTGPGRTDDDKCPLCGADIELVQFAV